MDTNYEINRSTFAIIPVNDHLTKIIESNNEFLVEAPILKIIDESCRSFGSSYIGRHEGTKKIVGISYKAPIIINESHNIIFFPTHSSRSPKCIWISLNNIKEYCKKNNNAIIQFTNHKNLELDVSYYVLENQILKASMLEAKLLKFKIN